MRHHRATVGRREGGCGTGSQGYGNTPLEESLGESLDQRVAQEVPEPDPYELAAGDRDDADHGDTNTPAAVGYRSGPDEEV